MRSPRADLAEVVATAARWSLASSIAQRVAQVGVGVVVARLVVPADMGVYASALVAVALVVGISELGVSVAVVRTQRPVHLVAPTATTIALTWSLVITGGLMVCAPWLAAALGSPSAAGPLRLMALAVVVGGVSAVPAAQAQRTFRHRRRAASDLIGFGTGALTTVVMAAAGTGAWSLAAGRVVTNLVAAVVLMSAPTLRSRLGYRRDAARELLGIGLPLTGAGLVALALWQIDYVVVGRHLGGPALGVYVLAFNLASWPVTALSVAARAVTLPAFAELRGDADRFRSAFPLALRTVLSAALPAAMVITITAPSLIRVVYGVRWNAAGEVLVVLAWLGAVRVVVDVAVDFLAAAGRTAAVLWGHTLWFVTLTPALMVGARVGGLRGVGLAHVVTATVVALPVFMRSVSALGVSARLILHAVSRPAAATSVGGLAGFAVTRPLPDDLSVLVVGASVSLMCCVAVLWPARPWNVSAPSVSVALDPEVRPWP
jgi:O-antigen/teichoic acid export membrane protein